MDLRDIEFNLFEALELGPRRRRVLTPTPDGAD